MTDPKYYPPAKWNIVDTPPLTKNLLGVEGNVQKMLEAIDELDLGARYKGEWNSETVYLLDDVVLHNSSSYICILGNTDQEPPNETYWNIFAAQGIQGEQGDPGEQGIQGEQGDQGEPGPTEIAEGQTLDGYSKKLQWEDDNEYITTAGRTITIAIGDTGYKRGKGIIFNATYPDYAWEIIFTTDAGEGLSYGGRASATFNTIKSRSKAFGDTSLTDASLNTSPHSWTRNYLVSVYIEGSDLKLVFDTAASATLHAKIDVELMKG